MTFRTGTAAGPPTGRRLVLGALGVAVAGAGAVGWLDWDRHRPAEPPGRAATLCDLPTGAGTPLGRLLPDGGQETEERLSRWVLSTDPKGCSVRVDGRTALTVRATVHDGSVEPLPVGDARPDEVRSFGAGSRSASWPAGAAVAEYCPGKQQPIRHVVVEVAPGEAARTGRPDGDRADFESIASGLLGAYRKAVCA
ncbi:hypothetical protein J5Y04_40695 [Kitasatospora sp. RG8]|uniref:hypothetical protein n=1 Tax=Kitasatospora sp. RG8 TaxID=2820815 RepID=UPI001AE079BC|nr:hypothetical protein [Kitasatospora sp. RG8]MBP0455798.1 hypothetical protein [Kitasatospora sp. RG8]